ncbi:MAG: hypothetical protein ACKPGK_11175, partial [Verrucomicrobiota bacterium]
MADVLASLLRRSLLRATPILLLATRLGGAPAEAPADPDAAWLAEHYTKYEHRIPMRDGVR